MKKIKKEIIGIIISSLSLLYLYWLAINDIYVFSQFLPQVLLLFASLFIISFIKLLIKAYKNNLYKIESLIWVIEIILDMILALSLVTFIVAGTCSCVSDKKLGLFIWSFGGIIISSISFLLLWFIKNKIIKNNKHSEK